MERSPLHEKLDLHKFARANKVQKSANYEKITGKDGKYRIYLLVYIGLKIRGPMRTSLPLN